FLLTYPRPAAQRAAKFRWPSRSAFPGGPYIQRCCQKKRAVRHGLVTGSTASEETIAQNFSKIKSYESAQHFAAAQWGDDVFAGRPCGYQQPVYSLCHASRAACPLAGGAQSPPPGASEKYLASLPSSPSFSLASGSGSRRSVRLGHIEAYLVLSASHSSSPDSVSGLMASAGHSGSHTPQSIHSSGWITSMFSPS